MSQRITLHLTAPAPHSEKQFVQALHVSDFLIFAVSSTTSETTKKPAKTLKDFAPWDYVKEETGEEFEPVKTKEDHEDKEGYQQDASFKTCDEKELAKFKEELLAFHCKRFEEPDCKLELQQGKKH